LFGVEMNLLQEHRKFEKEGMRKDYGTSKTGKKKSVYWERHLHGEKVGGPGKSETVESFENIKFGCQVGAKGTKINIAESKKS